MSSRFNSSKANNLMRQQNESSNSYPGPCSNTKYGSKEERCASISGFIEAGYVWLGCKGQDYTEPNKAAEHLMYCSQYFPKGDPNSDILDIVDSMSQALAKLAQRCLITNRDKIVEEDNERRFIKPASPEYDPVQYD